MNQSQLSSIFDLVMEKEQEISPDYALEQFMKSCFEHTTDFKKCSYCEFRFKCFTVRKKDEQS